MAVGVPRIDLADRRRGDADLRIEGAVALVVVAAAGQRHEGSRRKSGVAIVERLERGDGFAASVKFAAQTASGETTDSMGSG